MWTCSYCGRENADEWPTCPQCGKQPEQPAASKASLKRTTLRQNKAFDSGSTGISAEQAQNEAAIAQADTWNQTVIEWLTHIGEEAGGTYKTSESEHFIMLSAFARDSAASALRSAENALKTLRASLGPAAGIGFLGKHALIVMRDQDDYDRYVAQYFPVEPPPEGTGASPTPEDYTHVSLADTGDRLDLRILASELSYNLLAHLPLPRWLTEGLVSLLTRRVTRQRFTFDPDLGTKHREIWNGETIQAFWSGLAFESPRLTNFAYSLADILVTLLSVKGIEMIGFIRSAHFRDAGESAALDQLGFSLGDIAGEFLGPGEWRPQSTDVRGENA